MPPEIIALIDKPWLLAIVLALSAALGIAVERFAEGQKRAERRAYWQGRNAGKPRGTVFPFNGSRTSLPLKGTPERAIVDAAEQLRTVMEAQFTERPLLNSKEVRLFGEVEQLVSERNSAWRVMAQVSVGEFVASANAKAYACINSKRVDVLLVDEHCRARHAIEYQGTGHHQGSAPARDAVKKEALRKAGIGYHEVVAGHTTPGDLRRLVERLMPKKPVDEHNPDAPPTVPTFPP